MGPAPNMTGVLIRGANLDTDTQKDQLCEEEGTEWRTFLHAKECQR